MSVRCLKWPIGVACCPGTISKHIRCIYSCAVHLCIVKVPLFCLDDHEWSEIKWLSFLCYWNNHQCIGKELHQRKSNCLKTSSWWEYVFEIFIYKKSPHWLWCNIGEKVKKWMLIIIFILILYISNPYVFKSCR